MKLLRKFYLFTITFFKAIFRLILGLRTPKGLIALFISFSIFYGWAIAFIIYGSIASNGWFLTIGSGVLVFWLAPGTPFFPIMIIATLFIQRIILRDHKTQSFRKIYNEYLGSTKKSEDDKIIEFMEDKTDFADPTPEELKDANQNEDL
ncbi:MAG: hypothetical protein RBQ91_05385 [Acholeplasma sp.]|nr:hypothetical protein [Acholeplasma sp.]